MMAEYALRLIARLISSAADVRLLATTSRVIGSDRRSRGVPRAHSATSTMMLPCSSTVATSRGGIQMVVSSCSTIIGPG